MESLSIAFTAVGRRVERLSEGLRVGSPAREDDDLTTNHFAVGGAIVFNLSPRVLALSAGPQGLLQ